MEKWVLDIKKRARTGQPPVSGGRSKKFGKISFEDLKDGYTCNLMIDERFMPR